MNPLRAIGQILLSFMETTGQLALFTGTAL